MGNGTKSLSRAGLLAVLTVLAALSAGSSMAGVVEVIHADSLAGPMRALKAAFEAKNTNVTINLTSGVSKQLAERILKGDACDVFAPSATAVIEQDLINKTVAGRDHAAARWYVVFSANEMVVITAKGNPLGIRQVVDLARPEVKFIRVTGEKDLATGRTIEFLTRAATLEGKPELAQKIVNAAIVDPSKPTSVPDVVRTVREGRAHAGVVYYSAAVAAQNDVGIVRFPATVNMSETIRNAATVPGTAQNPQDALNFVRYLLSLEGQKILEHAGQPPVVPAMRKGDVPPELND